MTDTQITRVQIAGTELCIDLARAHSLAIDLRFDAPQPRWFGAPQARSAPLQLGDFSGSVAHGAGCNCQVWQLTPHCNGTHTESVGHLTREPCHVHEIAPRTLLPALLLSVTPQRAADGGESSDPAPQADDTLITRQALQRAWPAQLPIAPAALLIRTLPNSPSKLHRDYDREPAAFLSREAAALLVERGIEHLLLDVPSADRAHDQGRLCAHRVFFGLAPGMNTLAAARRPQCTITELAWFDESLADGSYLLSLQLPAIAGDAVPSRPLLYSLLS